MAGWDDLEEQEAPDRREADQKRDDLNKLCARVLQTEDGLKLLAWLRQVYVDVPIAVPGADPSHAYFAEGARNVVRDLLARCEQARKP